jgi:hypothetical protein
MSSTERRRKIKKKTIRENISTSASRFFSIQNRSSLYFWELWKSLVLTHTKFSSGTFGCFEEKGTHIFPTQCLPASVAGCLPHPHRVHSRSRMPVFRRAHIDIDTGSTHVKEAFLVSGVIDGRVGRIGLSTCPERRRDCTVSKRYPL